MVSIYALIDPRNGIPFYIGATKYIKSRLSYHKADALMYSSYSPYSETNERRALMLEIIQAGYKLDYTILLNVSEKAASKAEHYIYNLCMKEGVWLNQSPNRFYWANSIKDKEKLKNKVVY